jgi:probable F420-dependent oxidoreductase
MLELAAARADGVNTWLMTPDHTARSAAALRDGATLVVGKMCLLCDEPDEARGLARRALATYVGLDYYQRAWSALGFGASDFADGGSDHLVDSLVAWGDGARIRDQLQAHRDAGAGHLMVVPLNRRGGAEPDWDLLEALA